MFFTRPSTDTTAPATDTVDTTAPAVDIRELIETYRDKARELMAEADKTASSYDRIDTREHLRSIAGGWLDLVHIVQTTKDVHAVMPDVLSAARHLSIAHRSGLMLRLKEQHVYDANVFIRLARGISRDHASV